jgi:hypothetical protein
MKALVWKNQTMSKKHHLGVHSFYEIWIFPRIHVEQES